MEEWSDEFLKLPYLPEIAEDHRDIDFCEFGIIIEEVYQLKMCEFKAWNCVTIVLNDSSYARVEMCKR